MLGAFSTAGNGIMFCPSPRAASPAPSCDAACSCLAGGRVSVGHCEGFHAKSGGGCPSEKRASDVGAKYHF